MFTLFVLFLMSMIALRVFFGFIALIIRIGIFLSPIGLLMYLFRPRRIRRYYY